MKIQKIALTYLIALGIAAFLNMRFPLELSTFIDFLFPTKIDLTSQGFIRYRMLLFAVASILFLIFLPITLRFGLFGMTSEKIKKVHWRHIAILVFAVPICWMGYPFIALCPTCWTANDVFYFFLTVSVFMGLQISSQAVFLRMLHVEAMSGPMR
jgi:hypothetical protein